jgi:DNA polymerase-3 subunit delta'
MKSPLENPHLFGHAEAEAQLYRLIQQQKLPHAILFSGAEGIGKATLATRLARYLLVDAPPPEPVMGLFGEMPAEEAAAFETLATSLEHPVVKRMIAGSHSDFLVISPRFDEKKKTSVDTVFIDQIREVVEFMHRTSADGKWRIVLIDPAEAMNTPAANALLKVLEEPPANALLLLVTHQIGRLLPTIRSRCRKITLQTPSLADCQKIITDAGESIAEDDLVALLILTQSSPGKAIHYHQQQAVSRYHEILAVMAQPSPKAISKLAASIAKAPEETWVVYKALLLLALSRLNLSAALGGQFQPISPEETACFTALLQRKSPPQWVAVWEKAELALQQITTLTMDKQQTLLSILQMVV